MAKIGFTKLSLKRKNEVKTITINNNQIEIKQYLPVNEKLDLIARVINGAHDQNNFPNPIKIEVIGTLEMIMAYTNISFTEKQREDEAKLYDTLLSSGLLDMIINAIPEDDYRELKEYIEILEQKLENNEKSMAAKLSDFMEMLPDKMKEAAEIAEKFDPKQFQNVINFATAANGGRPIDFSKEDL